MAMSTNGAHTAKGIDEQLAYKMVGALEALLPGGEKLHFLRKNRRHGSDAQYVIGVEPDTYLSVGKFGYPLSEGEWSEVAGAAAAALRDAGLLDPERAKAAVTEHALTKVRGPTSEPEAESDDFAPPPMVHSMSPQARHAVNQVFDRVAQKAGVNQQGMKRLKAYLAQVCAQHGLSSLTYDAETGTLTGEKVQRTRQVL